MEVETMSQTSMSHDPPALPTKDMDVSFRAAMRELAGGVAVITVGRDDDITGFTATFASAHLRWCIGKATTTCSSALSQA
jgi:flavin reductase (DIM6/NTAB) family NADH-FMN oxidoreductase RutF